jgi:hypothetical protein
MTRWKASAIHLTLSVLVLCTIAAVLVWRWYPPGLFHMANADKLLLIIAGVDVVMGPLLTLIIYKQGKKSLKFDLTVIALLQVAALGFGLRTLWESRPIYFVDSGKYFDLVFANEIDPADLPAAKPQFRTLPMFGARAVGIVVPTDPKEREKALDLALAGKDMQFVPANYLPHEKVVATLLANTPPITLALEKLSAQDRETLQAVVRSTGLPISDLALVPLYSSRGGASLLLDARTGQIIRPVAVAIP